MIQFIPQLAEVTGYKIVKNKSCIIDKCMWNECLLVKTYQLPISMGCKKSGVLFRHCYVAFGLLVSLVVILVMDIDEMIIWKT